jgi:membrane associated rhomboid family serine protease
MYSQNTGFSTDFRQNSVLNRLLYANVAVFLIIQVLTLLGRLMKFDSLAVEFAKNWLAVPASLGALIFKPWTVFTYMFLHLDFWHILTNMLWLYFLGQLFVQFLGERKLWTVYIAGGVAGALLYILFFNIFPLFADSVPFSKALGASASVMAVIIGVGTYAPNFSIRLLILGSVKLKYIAMFWIVFDFFNIASSNAGGHIAHLGGAAMGFFFAREWKKGNDITLWVEKSWGVIKALFVGSGKSRSRMKVKYSKGKKPRRGYPDEVNPSKEQQKKVDQILDKISKSGYDSLTKDEKDFLFKASQNR